jgi:hypothetical protein
MDILNFISWIKGGRVVNTVDQVKTLIPLGVKDNKRDDGYIACAISVEDLAAQIGGLQTVAVDGVTITGNGTSGNPLVAIGGGLGGTQYVFVAADGTDLQNAAELQAAYVTAQGMSPSITNRITVIAAPGSYNFNTVNFEMDTDYIDLVSLDGNKSIVFNGSNTIEITTNDVFVRGVDVGTLSFTVANSLNLLRVENCSGGDYSFGWNGTASGTFTNCTGLYGSFGGDTGTANGVFTNCTGGNFSFGGNGIASGVFTDCTGLDRAFGSGGTADGTFTDCSGGDDSFGGNAGTASGGFTNCTGGDNSFGGGGGTASGTFINCIGGFGSLGGNTGTASGVFTNCTGADRAFGWNGNADGTFTNCTGRGGAFGGGGTASGVFNSCIGGSNSFGDGGTLDGFLYYCRLTSGSFETVSGAGVTRLCIDGSNVENNQG